jgi:ComF family protein
MQYSQLARTCQPMWRRAVDSCHALARALWPSLCILCRQRGQQELDLCSACEKDLPWNESACRVCALPLPEGSASAQVCGACSHRPPPFERSIAPLRYAYPVDHLIHGLKFRRKLACGRVLGELLARYVLAHCSDGLPEIILPIPLAARRYRERGYNQACELGLPLTRLVGVPMRADLLVRQRETLEQLTLDRQQRRRNVRDAFAVVGSLPARHVAILDDVVTTGSTVTELARVLRRAGAERVDVWAVARAGR